MILNIFILVLAVEIIAKRPPERPPDGGPIIKYHCQPGKRLWCSRNGVPPDPRLKSQFSGPFFPIPPVKCSRAPDPDGPGPVNVNPDPDWPTGPTVPYDPYDPGPIYYGPFVPIPPVKCRPIVPIPPIPQCGTQFGGPIPDPGCGPKPYTPRDPTTPKWRRLLPCCLCCKINQMTQLTWKW